VRYVWLAIMAVAVVPLLFAGMLLNPVFLVVLGSQWWLDWLGRLHPYRWWIVFSGFVFVFSLAVYLAHYT
jgi:hypothetical protein